MDQHKYAVEWIDTFVIYVLSSRGESSPVNSKSVSEMNKYIHMVISLIHNRSHHMLNCPYNYIFVYTLESALNFATILLSSAPFTPVIIFSLASRC